MQEERERSPWCKARRVVEVVCKPFVGVKKDERRIEVSSEEVVMLLRSVCFIAQSGIHRERAVNLQIAENSNVTRTGPDPVTSLSGEKRQN